MRNKIQKLILAPVFLFFEQTGLFPRTSLMYSPRWFRSPESLDCMPLYPFYLQLCLSQLHSNSLSPEILHKNIQHLLKCLIGGLSDHSAYDFRKWQLNLSLRF